MSRPLVTAYMPVYNGETYLKEALESMLAQDYEPYEVIVCDDGSTDGTRNILAGYPRVRVVHQENSGRAAACNAAIAVSSGEYLAGFDADDLWPADRLSMQAEFLAAHPQIGCVLGRQHWMNPPPWFGRDALFGDLDGIPLVSAMFRRSVFTAVGGFDPTFKYSEDMDILIRLRENGFGVHILPEILVHRRFHAGQMTANPPSAPPILRSLREKLERERRTQGDA